MNRYVWLAATLRMFSPKPEFITLHIIRHTKCESECRLEVELNGLQQTEELRGSELTAAENKAMGGESILSGHCVSVLV